MYFLIYVSSAKQLMNEDELLSLLQTVRDKNKRLGITGVLLYQGGNFMQMLEGEERTVLDLYEKIKKDDRHKDLNTIITGDIAERNFDDWSMGFCNMDKAGEYLKYSNYINENIVLRSFDKDSEDAYKFMLLFHEINR